MRRERSEWRAAAVLVLTCWTAGCATATRGLPNLEGSFFPLAPRSHWEYVVSRHAGASRLRFMATVRQGDFVANDGRACRVVDERYTDVGEEERFPVLYCAEGGFLHRVMSLEYRGGELTDTGLRSGELKFLPTDLRSANAWEGLTNAYRLPDGSALVVEQFHRAMSAREDVSVPAGRFAHCVRVDTTAVHYATGSDGAAIGPRVTYYYADWYAPGVGLVKTEQRGTDAEVLATIELVRYEIGTEASAP